MKPMIGVVANKELNRLNLPTSTMAVSYTSSIERAGGVPLIFPYSSDRSLLELLGAQVAGFVFPGGIDVNPGRFYESPHPRLGPVDNELDEFQFTAFAYALASRKPVLAICRGAQVANVALGGSLFQDIPQDFEASTICHRQDGNPCDASHPVSLEQGSRLYNLFGPNVRVNSLHHQSIRELGRDLRITGRSPDGVVESAEHEFLPIDLIQWHPELMMQKDDLMLPLFRSFVRNCESGV